MTIPSDAVRRAVRYNGKKSYYVWFISDEWREKHDLHYVEFDSKESAMFTLLVATDVR